MGREVSFCPSIELSSSLARCRRSESRRERTCQAPNEWSARGRSGDQRFLCHAHTHITTRPATPSPSIGGRMAGGRGELQAVHRWSTTCIQRILLVCCHPALALRQPVAELEWWWWFVTVVRGGWALSLAAGRVRYDARPQSPRSWYKSSSGGSSAPVAGALTTNWLQAPGGGRLLLLAPQLPFDSRRPRFSYLNEGGLLLARPGHHLAVGFAGS